MTRRELAAKVADVEGSYITQVGSLGQQREWLLRGQKLLIQSFRHGFRHIPEKEVGKWSLVAFS